MRPGVRVNTANRFGRKQPARACRSWVRNGEKATRSASLPRKKRSHHSNPVQRARLMNRREFLRGATAASIGTALGGCVGLGGEGHASVEPVIDIHQHTNYSG